MQVREVRTGLDRLLALMKDKHRFRVGILDKGTGEHEGSGMKIVDIAKIHEFGLGTAPERSFIRGWYIAEQDTLRGICLERYQQAVKVNVDLRQISEQLAVHFSDRCKNRMVSGWTYPDIDQRTKDRKGSSTPLIDTGFLKASITGEVF